MSRPGPVFRLGFALLLASATWGVAAAVAGGAEPVRKPHGIEKRVPWTTSRVRGSPEPLPPYVSEVAFPKLRFDEPLNFAVAPGQPRIFIAERQGKIFSFANRPDVGDADKKLLLDLKRTTYGLAFHPKFADNRFFFVTYVADDAPEAEGTRLSRFQARADDPLKADLASETVLLTWPRGGHNGGCLRFGPDGHLYVATGDASGIADELKTGQDISDLPGSILRVDVDKPSDKRAYSIPADNPFAKTQGARPEVYAYGLRQVWKFSFDRRGALWAGDVGQDLWESILLIAPGGNYGWSVNEGSRPFRPERPRGPTPILKPIVEHHHTDFRSITGGYVYEGSRLPELRGMYIYGDYDTGRVWGLRYDHDKRLVTEHRELADGVLRIVEWGLDAAGELYFVDHIGGQLHRLVAAPRREASDFPRKLSETGLFASTKDHAPAPGLIPYSVNSELWSDGAHKERFLALPGLSQIDYNAITYPQPAPGAPPGWRFPDGTVVVKTFWLEMEKGDPTSRKRLETRLLHFEQTPGTQEVGDQVWQGYTYVWNDEQTDAELAPKEGAERVYKVQDAAAPGGVRDHAWRFPSRAQCGMCHTTPAKYVLGVNTLQMNKDHDYGGVIANQLATLAHLGVFKQPLPDAPEKLPRLGDYRDEKLPTAERARAYLQSNCAHCHMKWGGGNAEFQLLATLPVDKLGVLNTPPSHGAFGVEGAALIAPGHPERSLVARRMRLLGLGRMPHIASHVVDEPAAALIEQWIRELKPAQ